MSFFPLDALEAAERRSVERIARIKSMVERGRRQLGLEHWDIRYNPNVEPEVHEVANITYSDSDRAAVITLRREVDYQKAEAVVTHELLHAVLRPYTTMAERLLVHVADDLARTHLNEMLDDAEEEVIEQITRALVSGAPRIAFVDLAADQAWGVFE